MMSEELRIGLAGTGGIGRTHIERVNTRLQGGKVIACGNWSQAPHIDLDEMLASEEARNSFMDAIAKRGLVLEVLNCSGNQLAPNEEGKQHQAVVEKTFQLAGQI